MKFFDNWFRYQVKKAMNYYEDDQPVPVCTRSNGINDGNEIIDHRRSMSIKMQAAKGGTIVQLSHYDSKSCEWEHDLYIITDDKNLGEELSSIMAQYRLTHL